jgi:hypothetical protein
MKNESVEITVIILFGIMGISQILFNEQWAKLSNWWMNKTLRLKFENLLFFRASYYCLGLFSMGFSAYFMFF